MKAGVYVDGFNLYYGARELCGRGTAGWRWLDIRPLVASQLPLNWSDTEVGRVVYCTARLSGIDDPTAPRDQDRYLRALEVSGCVDHLEFGHFVRRVRHSPLVTANSRGRPKVVRSRWPVMIKDAEHSDVPEARFVVSHLHREEKGSDVNVATHLMHDVFCRVIDRAIVVSNDSDLRLPIAVARTRVPVGIITPGRRIAGDLALAPGEGAGLHWQTNLSAEDLRRHQLPDPVGPISKPCGW